MAGSNIEQNPNADSKLKKQAFDDTADVPSEFGGIPGHFGNADGILVPQTTRKYGVPYDSANPLRPDQERTSLMQTDTTDASSAPKYGTGGVRVA